MKFPSALFVPFLLAVSCVTAGTSAIARDIITVPGDSLEKARDEAQSGDRIILHGGTYQLTETLTIGPQNSGVTWMAYKDEKPVISGGVPVTGWSQDTNGIWKARIDRGSKLRQLYVNDRPANMDEAPGWFTPLGWRGTFTIEGNEPWAADGPDTASDGLAFQKASLPKLSNPADLELQQQKVWTIQRVGFRTIEDSGKEWVAKFDQPAAAAATKFPWGCALDAGPSRLFNAYEFLTQPGQFYFNTATGWLYYKPRADENMATAAVVAPTLEMLVLIQGENLQKHARSVRFEGITFAHTSFAMMQMKGCNSHGDLCVQSNAMSVMYKNDGNAHKEPWGLYDTLDVAPSAVKVTSAEDVTFQSCVFRDLGCQALHVENDVVGATINGNVFQSIEGGCVTIGHPQHCYIGKQNGDNNGWGPYHFDNSHDKWDESVEGLCRQVTVSNNLFRNVCWNLIQMIPITLYYGHDVSIVHNDIANTPYSGVTCGWGWGECNGIPGRGKFSAWARKGGCPSLSMSQLKISFNRIADTSQVLGDSAAIYFLGDLGMQAKNPLLQQDFAEMNGNYLVEDKTRGRADLIGCDEGTSYLRIENNVLDGRSGVASVIHRGTGDRGKLFINNWLGYQTEEVETNFADRDVFAGLNHFVERPAGTNVKLGDWPAPAQEIIKASGLEPEYRDLVKSLK